MYFFCKNIYKLSRYQYIFIPFEFTAKLNIYNGELINEYIVQHDGWSQARTSSLPTPQLIYDIAFILDKSIILVKVHGCVYKQYIEKWSYAFCKCIAWNMRNFARRYFYFVLLCADRFHQYSSGASDTGEKIMQLPQCHWCRNEMNMAKSIT